MGDEKTRERIEMMVVEWKVDSYHHPVTVRLGEGTKVRKKKKGGKARRKREVWTKEGKEEFARLIGSRTEGAGGAEEEWKEPKGRIGEVLERVEGMGKEERAKGWWDGDCREGKKSVRRELRRWRKEGGGGDRYREVKRAYNRLCEKKREEARRWEEEVKEARTENHVWKIVNRERKKKKWVNEGIELEEWDRYFKGLLGGVEWRVRRAKRGRGGWGGRDKNRRDYRSDKEVKGWKGDGRERSAK